MSDIIAKLQWFVADSDPGQGYLLSKPEAMWLVNEIARLRKPDDIPWGQEVPVLTFEQIRDEARNAKNTRVEGLKGANG